MKQHITQMQMYEVKDSKLAKLMDDNKFNDLLETAAYRTDFVLHQMVLRKMASMVTIGKMIEILEQHQIGIEIVFQDEIWAVCLCLGSVGGEEPATWDKEIEFYSSELCDTLWEAVKEVLE